MQGLLLIDKPKNWTSFDVVNFVRKLVAGEEGISPKKIKVGHTGTLDPLATGLLVLLIGKDYTRQAESLTKLDKVYEVELHLGEVTDSHDSETESRFQSDYEPTEGEIKKLLATFIGPSMQVPPIYSAIKVDGKRAYKLARQGQVAELKPRPVEIYSLEFISYDYPTLKVVAHVSSGTYIRSLVSDMGEKLTSGAYMSELRRTKVGKFDLSKALVLDGLNAEQIKASLFST